MDENGSSPLADAPLQQPVRGRLPRCFGGLEAIGLPDPAIGLLLQLLELYTSQELEHLQLGRGWFAHGVLHSHGLGGEALHVG